MKVNNPLLDTNIIIRFLTRDDPKQADRIEKLFNDKKIPSFTLPDLVFAEIIYVLLSVYKLSKEETAEKMSLLLEFEKIRCNKKILKTAIELFLDSPISFIDAYLLSLIQHGYNPYIFSLDEKMAKMKKGLVKRP